MSTTVIVGFQAKPDQVPALLTFLGGIQPGMLEAGAQNVALLQDQDDPTCVFEVEEWTSAAEHKRFVDTAAAGAFAPFDALLAAPFQVRSLRTFRRSGTAATAA